VKFW